MKIHARALGVLFGLVASPSAFGDDAAIALRASIICEAPSAPGRFRCDVEARSSGGRLSWADVVVVKVDDFILPLRGHMGARDASTHEADLYRWSLGFVAKGRGSGDVTLRVRAVVCQGERCDSALTEVQGHVVVGS